MRWPAAGGLRTAITNDKRFSHTDPDGARWPGVCGTPAPPTEQWTR